MVPFLVILSDLYLRFQDHNIIQRQVIRKMVQDRESYTYTMAYQ